MPPVIYSSCDADNKLYTGVCFTAMMFRNNTIRLGSFFNTFGGVLFSRAFHFSCTSFVTGAGGLFRNNSISFGGDIVFANNTAEENAGMAVKCTLLRSILLCHSLCCVPGKKIGHPVFNKPLASQSESCTVLKARLFSFLVYFVLLQ